MRFYLSHSIRGKYGKGATQAQMKENCDKAIRIANEIRKTFPQIDVYVPSEHEDFVGIAYRDKYLTEKQILEIDCKIIDGCEGIIIYAPHDDPMQGGREVEYRHAALKGIPTVLFTEVSEAICWLTSYLLGV